MSGLFEFITYPMELGLVWLAVAVGSAGIGIILFTIFVRLVLSPLQIVQLRNAKAMQRVQPLIAELRQKHGKDRQKMTEETMKLYREHNVNPALGCGPTILQFPILIGLFYALFHLGNSLPDKFPHACNGFLTHNSVQWFQHCYAIKNAVSNTNHIYDLFHAQFLWLSDGLGRPDPLYILPVLAGVTQWIQSRMLLTRSTDPQQQMMNSLMNFMPLMIVFFATRYASGLSLYWVTSTLIGIAIQYRVTGLGLLPEAFGGIFRRLGWRAPGSARTIAGKDTRPTASREPNRKRPATKSPTGAGKGAGPAMNLTDVNGAATSGDGTNGATEGTAERPPAPRPRKKANRARGGRGGRRG